MFAGSRNLARCISSNPSYMISRLSECLYRFTTSGFVELDASQTIEEETLALYKAHQYYPAHIGEVLESRYQLVSKLGYGTGSTTWLCRDLKERKHACLLYQPLGMSFTELHNLLPSQVFFKGLVQWGTQLISIALLFMHQMGEDEIARPITRKVLPDHAIYFSRPLPLSPGPPVLCDLGEARVGGNKHNGDVLPSIYRAPEFIPDMEWGSSVDKWSIGTMLWDLAQGDHLFYAKKDRILNDEQHLAEIISLKGPPPAEFIQRSEKCSQYWDKDDSHHSNPVTGNRKGSIPIPEQSFETREVQLSGEDRELFIDFLRRILLWVPEERPTAEGLAYDTLLMQALKA
ncbi:kinase-like domain-containing protein [Aspergillus venezuelensis]